jgi:SagB-type dehydrogenase family enzyme
MEARKFVVSRFATLAWSNGKGIVVSPVTAQSVELADDRQFILLNRFRKPLALSSLPPEERELAEVLIAGGVLVAADGREERGALQAWEPHDLSFHVLSRRPRQTEFRLRGSRAPEPLFVRRASGTLVRLVRPEAGTTRHARSFWEVLEARSSTREFLPAGLSLPLLSALLFFSARSRSVSHDKELGDTDRRGYPSGGGRYPLEIHLVVPPKACAGLRAGTYHYRPKEHALERTAGFGVVARKFLERASVSCPPLTAERGWLLVAISARLARTSWKYDSIAYAVILKEVGCLMQTLYLAASALRLGVCALGSGPLDLLPRLTGVDAFLEPQVGEMVIGRPGLSAHASSRAPA